MGTKQNNPQVSNPIPCTWQIRFEPQSQPQTLADISEDVDVIACDGSDTACHVMFRRGDNVFYRNGDGSESKTKWRPNQYKFIRYFENTPKPISLDSLDELPDCRVIQQRGVYYWRYEDYWYVLNTGGFIELQDPDATATIITDFIMELK